LKHDKLFVGLGLEIILGISWNYLNLKVFTIVKESKRMYLQMAEMKISAMFSPPENILIMKKMIIL
jgi:hypothetical protein